MKIGILTLPLHTNYGGILQAYALQTVLKQMGHDAWLIDRRHHAPQWKVYYKIARRIVKRLIGRQTVILLEKQRSIAYQYTLPFIEKQIYPRTETFYTEKSLKQGIMQYHFDAFVVGSDQIWRPAYFPHIEEAFFSFVWDNHAKRIAYATSFGSEDWEYTGKQTQKCTDLVKGFNGVSVREQSAVGMCKKYFKIDATQVLDPTMLLTSDDYTRLFDAGRDTREKAGELFVYILDETEEKQAVINKVARQLGYTPFRVKTRNEKKHIPLELCIASPVEEWIRSFYDAKFIITDSFHGCVFAILFNKPFILYPNKKRGLSRFQSLLEIFDLKDRMFHSFSELTVDKIQADIDWKQVNGLLDHMRQSSKDFLINALYG